ncbi:MAG: thioredoxin family protein [Verrucomicrobiota bacterium]|nr:thioredoxin family protein [Verrucomicrobiota bacterium]
MRIIIAFGLAYIFVSGCKPKTEPASPVQTRGQVQKISEDNLALTHLGQAVFEAFISGEIDRLQPHALWGVPDPALFAGMQQVYVVDARITQARLQSIPATNRTAIHIKQLKKLKVFLADPTREFERLKAALKIELSALRQQHQALFKTHSGPSRPQWGKPATSVVVRSGTHLATPLPEGAVDVLFSNRDRSYQLKLNNCVKLPGHGWVLGADLDFVDLAVQAAAEREWSEDFPAAQVRATDEKKQLLVNFTRSDWGPQCIALHQKVLNTKDFLDFAEDRYVLVTVDFPRNRPQADNQRQANLILSREYNVQSFPTVLILEANGTEAQRVSDYNGTSPAQFIQSLKKNQKK